MKYLVLLALMGINAFLILSKPRKAFLFRAPENGGTVLMPYLYLEQLDPRNPEKRHRRYPLSQDLLLNSGIAVTRSGGPMGEVPLDCAFNETLTVGEEHALVALDDYGCFIQNNHPNGMRVMRGDALVQVDEVSIEEGTVVYLGEQPIRFCYPQIKDPGRPSPRPRKGAKLRLLLGDLIGFARTFYQDTSDPGGKWEEWD